MPSIDEMYEYWFLRKNTSIEKTITSTGIKFKLMIPNGVNFFFHELSFLLSDINSIEDLAISTDTSVYGMSFAVNGQSVLVNLNFNNQLPVRAEKYVSILESNPTMAYAKDDAEYFT